MKNKIIQVTDREDSWFGTLCIITDTCMGGNGYLVYTPVPTKGPAYYRVHRESCEVVGEAIVGVPDDD